MYDIKRYLRATSARHASELMLAHPDSRLLAGGTDVLIQLHHHNAQYAHIVDIHGLPELCGITMLEDGSLRIGSGTTFTQLIEHPLIQMHLPMLAEAAATIAGPQIRNVATYGGNICNGATSADSAAPSVALKAQLEILTPDGVTIRPIDGFHTGPGKVALTLVRSCWPSAFIPTITAMLAAPISSTPCAVRWILPPSAVQRCVALSLDASASCVWLTASRHRRRSAARRPSPAPTASR